MLKRSLDTALLPLRDMPENAFFRMYPDGKYLIAVHDDDLPPGLRKNEDSCALFAFRSFDRPHAEKGQGPLRIIVEEIDFELNGDSLVAPGFPVDRFWMANGARLWVDDSETSPDRFLRIGMRISSEGRLLFTPHR